MPATYVSNKAQTVFQDYWSKMKENGLGGVGTLDGSTAAEPFGDFEDKTESLWYYVIPDTETGLTGIKLKNLGVYSELKEVNGDSDANSAGYCRNWQAGCHLVQLVVESDTNVFEIAQMRYSQHDSVGGQFGTEGLVDCLTWAALVAGIKASTEAQPPT
jgi:hypothetical protein